MICYKSPKKNKLLEAFDNLYEKLSYEEKAEIIEKCIEDDNYYFSWEKYSKFSENNSTENNSV